MIINCAEQSSLFAPLSRLKENFSQTLRGIDSRYFCFKPLSYLYLLFHSIVYPTPPESYFRAFFLHKAISLFLCLKETRFPKIRQTYKIKVSDCGCEYTYNWCPSAVVVIKILVVEAI